MTDDKRGRGRGPTNRDGAGAGGGRAGGGRAGGGRAGAERGGAARSGSGRGAGARADGAATPVRRGARDAADQPGKVKMATGKIAAGKTAGGKTDARRAEPRKRADGSIARDQRKVPAPTRAVKIASARDDGLHRIAKLLARAGVASRRDIERMIAEQRITLNGTIVTTPATLLADLSGVAVDGKAVDAPDIARLFLFHKPSGVLTAERDFSGRRTIYALIPPELPRIMPVGRLDLNTEGLLLLTNDGALKRALELPSSGVERTYRARTFGPITQDHLDELAEGITVEGVRYGRIIANLERSTGHNKWIELTLTEGKNREVRRVLEHLGLQVSRLIRLRYGQFVLGSSAPGDIEEVRGAEVAGLLRALNLEPAPGKD